MGFFPSYVEETKDGTKSWDVASRLMKDRIVFLQGEVEENMANHLVAQLLLLDSQSNNPIHMYVNSPGGQVTHGLAIYDTMRLIKSPVHTIVIGQAASMGSLLAQAGDKRYITENARHMVHRVSSGTQGTSGSVHVQELEFEDAKRRLEESKKINEKLTQIYVNHNSAGKTYEEVFETLKFDTYLSAQEAVEWGLVDEIIS
jgi:ATP-dependent Clp protease protease subunit